QQDALSHFDSRLQASKSLYENTIERLQATLQAERLEHQQALQAHADEHETITHALQAEINSLKSILEQERSSFASAKMRIQELEHLIPTHILSLSAEERQTLTTVVTQLLNRIELALEHTS
ncbi:MAG: hypothetical protein RML40_10985, partial [Bacteroidota bacterium]|nr:hypothetical protein [Candidatus Kapabacteria bacterium]MDW8221039.1 hypothetical protein [Bacteroidota bacterium]